MRKSGQKQGVVCAQRVLEVMKEHKPSLGDCHFLSAQERGEWSLLLLSWPYGVLVLWDWGQFGPDVNILISLKEGNVCDEIRKRAGEKKISLLFSYLNR